MNLFLFKTILFKIHIYIYTYFSTKMEEIPIKALETFKKIRYWNMKDNW